MIFLQKGLTFLPSLIDELRLVPETPIKASFVTALRRTLEIFYWDLGFTLLPSPLLLSLGDVQSAIKIYKEDSRHRLPYSEVQQKRQEWLQYRQHVKGGARGRPAPTPRYLTYADRMTDGLHNLLFSAKLSGVHLEVSSLLLPPPIPP